MSRRFLPLLLIAALTHPARADSCADQATQLAMNTCAGVAFKTADAHLNATYAQLLQRLHDEPDTKSLLVAAQRAWLQFRDADCAFSSSKVAGGSMQPFIVTECRTDLTRQRAAQLARYLACQEGDLSCPVPAP